MTLFDPGLQPERTELAWRRTALALGVGSLIAMRLLPAAFGDAWWTVPGVVGLVASGALWALARRRYRNVNAVLGADGERARMPGAGLLLGAAMFVAAIGITGAGVVISLALGRS